MQKNIGASLMEILISLILISILLLGIDAAQIASTQKALQHHELVKVRFTGHKTEKKLLAPQLADASESALVDILGHIALLYRAHPENPTLRLPAE